MSDSAPLRWLEDGPAIPTGVRWGVPWDAGVLSREDALEVRDGTGDDVPVQRWPTAYWPDGSVKWTGYAASFDADSADELEIARRGGGGGSNSDEERSINERPTDTLVAEETDEYVELDTGRLVCRINRRGSPVIREISREGDAVCTGGSLACIRESRREDAGRRIYEEERFEGRVDEIPPQEWMLPTFENDEDIAAGLDAGQAVNNLEGPDASPFKTGAGVSHREGSVCTRSRGSRNRWSALGRSGRR